MPLWLLGCKSHQDPPGHMRKCRLSLLAGWLVALLLQLPACHHGRYAHDLLQTNHCLRFAEDLNMDMSS